MEMGVVRFPRYLKVSMIKEGNLMPSMIMTTARRKLTSGGDKICFTVSRQNNF
jgi:hypothetical protein